MQGDHGCDAHRGKLRKSLCALACTSKLRKPQTYENSTRLVKTRACFLEASRLFRENSLRL